MESWKKVWRDGVVPLLSLEQLEALSTALEMDDPRLLQGATSTPPPLQCVQDWPVEAACAIGYVFAATNGGFADNGTNNQAATVAEVEEFFARCCYECDQLVNEPAGCRWFLNWFDCTPRDDMRALLSPEIQRSILERRDAEKESDNGPGTAPGSDSAQPATRATA